MSRSYTSSHPGASMACSGTALLFLLSFIKFIVREKAFIQFSAREWANLNKMGSCGNYINFCYDFSGALK
jgi:hypothetical protein